MISSKEAIAASNCPILCESLPMHIKYSLFLSKQEEVGGYSLSVAKADW
jgi:hypothetical protein